MSYFKSWKNTSHFPDAWARAVCDWIAARLDVKNVHMVIRHTSRGGHGRAWWDKAVCSIQRRDTWGTRWRRVWKYSTMKHDNDYIAKSPLEAFVMLVAHELYHTCPAGRQLISEKRDAGGHWRQAMEFRTNRAAWAIVEAYRLEHRGFLRLYASRLRRERKMQKQVRVEKSVKQSPEFRLSRAEQLAATWQAKAERAARAAKKWTVKANRIRAAIGVRDRRMAATPA